MKNLENAYREILLHSLFLTKSDTDDETFKELEKNTPARAAKAWQHFISGYAQNPKKILSKQFTTPSNDMVLVKDISFNSTCSHHLLPFFGKCAVGYIPRAHKVVGLSKISRLVECFALRLQMQETLAADIAYTLEENLACLGVGVYIEATHTCMSLRGVQQEQAKMITSVLLGNFQSAEVRAEFLSLVK